MRVVCEQCQAKYIVPDDKIVKNVLCWSCQKCGHVITTRVEKAPQTDANGTGTLEKWRATGLNTPRKLQNETPIWYYSYNGESFGPFTETELKDRLLSDKMSSYAEQCFVWCKNFTEWKPVLEVEPYASALLMPPPPPPAPPAIKKAPSENLPPLFSTNAANKRESTSAPAVASPKSSSPDLVGLKHRLLKTPTTPAGNMPERQRESLARLATSNLFGKVEISQKPQDDVPTHQAMPAIDEIAPEPEEDTGDTTRVGAPSPLLSFQSLDVTSSGIKRETTTDGASGKVRPFPSVSSLSSVSRTSGQNKESAFAHPQSPAPNISSLFGSKPAASPSSSQIPRFAGLRSISSSSTPAARTKDASQSRLNASDLLKKNNLGNQNQPENLTDFKEDIGDIVQSAEKPAISLPNKASVRDSSISSWLPSQSNLHLDSPSNDFSVGDIKLKSDVIDSKSAKDSLPSFQIPPKPASPSDKQNAPVDPNEQSDLPFIDMDDPSQDVSDAEVLDSSDVLPDIDMEEDSQLLSKDEVQAADAEHSDDIGDIDLEAEQSALPGVTDSPATSEQPEEDAEGGFMSSSDMLAMFRKSNITKAVPQNPAPVSDISDSSDLAEIDLDDESSQIIQHEVIESLEGDSTDPNAPRISGLVGADSLFDNVPGQEAKAKVSHSKLEEIAARHADLFAELEAAEPIPDHSESGISENSMMIQLAHIQKIQTKEKRKSKVGLIAAIVIVALVLIGMSIGGIVLHDREKTEVSSNTGFNTASGRTISSDELDERLVPVDDFEIIEVAPVAKKPSSGSGSGSGSGRSRSGSKAPTILEEAADAIYGAEEQNEPETKPTQAATRQDGRANVQFGKTNDFASTEGVQGSKYAVKGSSSSRDAFASGLSSVSRSVQDCARRATNTGDKMPPKIYLNLTIEPTGSVDTFTIQGAPTPEKFNNCLESKKGAWKFKPFEGSAVSIRQAFILG